VVAALAIGGRQASGGEVVLTNGDHISGRVLSLTGGELVVKSEAAGELTIDVAKLKTFSSDEVLSVRVGDGARFECRVAAGPDGKIEVRRSPKAPPELIAIRDIAEINAPEPAWTGEVMLNGKITGGDSKTTEAGFEFKLDKEWKTDRLHFIGEYMYGRERDQDTGLWSTSDDFGNGYGKYTHDVYEKLYLDVNAKALHDQLADLKYRFSPAGGIGYRWFDEPEFEFFTDVGIAYSDERFSTFGGRSFGGPQLEYGVEWKPVKRLRLFNTLEYYASLSDFTGNFMLDAQAGFHVTMWRHSFFELRGEYHHDTEPAPSAKTGEYRFIVGPGLEF
jgi:uncharacterized protein YndB with AHSA1/START domain